MPSPVFAPRLLSVLIAASLLPVGASAAETALPAVEVSGTREGAAPFAAEVESLPTLRATSSDTASLLRDAPGVSLYGGGGVSTACPRSAAWRTTACASRSTAWT